MVDQGGFVSVNKKFIISHVEGERSTGVRSRACAEQMPHSRLLLEDEGGNRQRIWNQTKSGETLVKAPALYIVYTIKIQGFYCHCT